MVRWASCHSSLRALLLAVALHGPLTILVTRARIIAERCQEGACSSRVLVLGLSSCSCPRDRNQRVHAITPRSPPEHTPPSSKPKRLPPPWLGPR